MKRLLARSLICWGILVVEATNKNQEDCPGDVSHLQRPAWDVTITLHGYRASVHISTGQPPPSLSIQHGGRASCGGRSPVNRSSAGIQAWSNLNAWRPCTTMSKEVETNFQQEGSSQWISRKNFVPKKVLPFQPDSRGKLTHNYEGSCAMTLVTTNGDNHTCPMNVGAVKKYSVKN